MDGFIETDRPSTELATVEADCTTENTSAP